MTISKRYRWISFLIFFVLGTFGTDRVFSNDNSDEGLKVKVSRSAKTIKRGTKKGIRKAQDKTCEVINGKTSCVAKKVKHSIQNEMDKAKDTVD